MNFKYSLDRSSKKFICPKCQKKTFVRYFDNIDQQYMEESLGRCDRESKCRYHNKPNRRGNYVKQTFEYSPPSPSYHNNQEIVKYGRNFRTNNLVQFLKIYFTQTEIQNVILRYLIGTSDHWTGATIFWRVDQFNNVRGGKVMAYNRNTGERVKKPYSKITWIHKINKQSDFVLQQCLFGLHLIKENNSKTVAIVESEKTAIIMCILMPENIWMATGSKTGLNEKVLQPLKGHKVILFPDKTEYGAWADKSAMLTAKGFKISCSRLLESYDLEEGADLADLFFKFKGCTNHTNKPLTPKAKNLQTLGEINPVVWRLVEEFGLV